MPNSYEVIRHCPCHLWVICVSTIGPFITQKRGIDTLDTAPAVFASWGKSFSLVPGAALTWLLCPCVAWGFELPSKGLAGSGVRQECSRVEPGEPNCQERRHPWIFLSPGHWRGPEKVSRKWLRPFLGQWAGGQIVQYCKTKEEPRFPWTFRDPWSGKRAFLLGITCVWLCWAYRLQTYPPGLWIVILYDLIFSALSKGNHLFLSWDLQAGQVSFYNSFKKIH